MKIFARFLSLLFILTITLFSHSLKAQNTALGFDGVNDYVDCSASSSFNATGIRTMECWVKFNDLSATGEILSKSIGGQGIELLTYGNLIAFYCMFSGSNTSFVSYSSSGMTNGTWYHIAVAWDGTKENMRLYVNGISVGARTDIGDINGTGIINPAGSFRIGQWSDPSPRPFNGFVEEVRVWNVTRTASQVKSGMYGTVAVNTAGLIAYYNMNDGSGTTLTNATATSGLNGVLTNGPVWVSSPVQFGGNALNFDGANDQVIVPANSAYNFTSGTIECYVRPGNLVGNAAMVSIRNTAGTRWSFHMSTTNNTIGMWNNSLFASVPFSITQGQWYHLAFVCNGTNIIVYVNGSNIGTINQTFNTLTGLTLVIGIAKNSGSDGEPFLGDIDEVRLWNTLRTQSEIQAYKDATLTGTEAGLVGLFSFDQGISAGNNAGLTIAIDKTSTNNSGQLTNFAMNGSTSNLITHSLIILPVNLSQFTAANDGALVRLQWKTEQEQNSREFIIERSGDGNVFNALGTIAAAGTSNNARYYSFNDNDPQKGNNYYRLKQVDNDGRFNYSAIRSIHFSTHPELTWYAVGNGNAELQLQQGNNEKYNVADMNGHTIKQGRLVNGKLSLSHLSAGSYSVSVETASGKVSSIIVIR